MTRHDVGAGPTSGGIPSALVISLDFELHWGVSERVSGPDHPYTASLRGARSVIPRLLSLFRRRGVHATWATVGALLATSRRELDACKPAIRPRGGADNYGLDLGAGETDDPLHFAPSLVEAITDTPGQELASHTFIHYFCDDDGGHRAAFEADLRAAQDLAARRGRRLRTLVFPRNQVKRDYLPSLPAAGIDVYRGNPPGGFFGSPRGRFGVLCQRAGRLADSYVSLTGPNTVSWSEIAAEYPRNVRASHLFRPYAPRLRALEPLRVRRVVASLRAAAERGEVVHLWWHPHNFGIHQDENLAALEAVFDELDRLRARTGMRSLTMAEAADAAADSASARPSAREAPARRAAG